MNGDGDHNVQEYEDLIINELVSCLILVVRCTL